MFHAKDANFLRVSRKERKGFFAKSAKVLRVFKSFTQIVQRLLRLFASLWSCNEQIDFRKN
jgi:hypothetical protein